MSSDRHPSPSVETHVPVLVNIPEDQPNDLAVGRPDIPPPSLWQRSVKVTHKTTKEPAIVATVDWSTNMFRAFYTERGDLDDQTGKPKGRFSERTEWEHCHDWDVEVTYSPRELARQAASKKLEEEIAKLDRQSMAAVTVLCDDPDPSKALAKLEALRALGVVRASTEAAEAVIAEVKAEQTEP